MAPSIEDYIQKAGEEKTPLPMGKIPRQWLPALIRWPIRVVFLPFILLDLAMQKIAVWIIRPPFKKVGKCKRRGNCCHYILMKKPKGLVGFIALFWNTQINGFFSRKDTVWDEKGTERLVMGCRYLQTDGRCGIYYFRPVVCRKWPVIEYFGYPKILKGCGYQVIYRDKKKRDDSSKLSIIP